MPNKVLYFLAGKVATQAEIDAVAAIENSSAVVQVRNGVDSANYNPNLEACDFVSGTVPAAYNTKPVWRQGNLAATQTIVANAQQLTVPVTGTYVTKATLTVANGAVTAIALS